jgi:hypothetical protein
MSQSLLQRRRRRAAAEQVVEVEAVADVGRHEQRIEVVVGDDRGAIGGDPGDLAVLPDLLDVEAERPAAAEIVIDATLDRRAEAVAEVRADDRAAGDVGDAVAASAGVEVVNPLEADADIRLDRAELVEVILGREDRREEALLAALLRPASLALTCTLSKQQNSSSAMFLLR